MKRLIFTFAAFFIATSAYAEAPNVDTLPEQLVDVDQTILPPDKQKTLQTRLEKAVFQLFVTNVKTNMIKTNVILDGIAVAVTPEAVKEVVDSSEIVEEIPQEETPKPAKKSSFFGVGLDRVSSPFHHEAPKVPQWHSERQYYLTTADWLTLADTCEIDIHGSRIEARIDYRDNAQNVAVLSTPGNKEIEPVEVYAGNSPVPSLVYLLLSPNSMLETLTAHTLSLTEAHLYGYANHLARNGYPMFSKSGALVGLSVGPGTSKTYSAVVHSKLLDRALHPQKYDKTTVEEIKLIAY